jgi:hypothetical protein
MTEVLETNDLTTPGQDGWAVDYRVKRDDDEEVYVQVRCTGTVEAIATATDNAETLAVIADRGRTEALRIAERVQSPARRGRVLVSVWFDPIDHGNVRNTIEYERPLE